MFAPHVHKNCLFVPVDTDTGEPQQGYATATSAYCSGSGDESEERAVKFAAPTRDDDVSSSRATPSTSFTSQRRDRTASTPHAKKRRKTGSSDSSARSAERRSRKYPPSSASSSRGAASITRASTPNGWTTRSSTAPRSLTSSTVSAVLLRLRTRFYGQRWRT